MLSCMYHGMLCEACKICHFLREATREKAFFKMCVWESPYCRDNDCSMRLTYLTLFSGKMRQMTCPAFQMFSEDMLHTRAKAKGYVKWMILSETQWILASYPVSQQKTLIDSTSDIFIQTTLWYQTILSCHAVVRSHDFRLINARRGLYIYIHLKGSNPLYIYIYIY